MPEPALDWLRPDELTGDLVLFVLPIVLALGVLRGRGRRGAALGTAAAAVGGAQADIPPAVAAVVAHGFPGRRAVLATVLDLGARGHLDIAAERLERRTATDGPLLPYEALLLEALFEDGPVATRADLAGRLARRLPAVRAAIEAEAAARGLVARDPRGARRRAALWFAAFALGAVLGMALSAGLALGAFLAAIIMGLGTARARRTAAGEMAAGRLRALALRLREAAPGDRPHPHAVALGVEPSGLEWLGALLDPPAARGERADGGGRDGAAGGGYGADGGASGGGGASRGW